MTKARIHCVKTDTGAGMATVIFFLIFNRRLMQLGDMSGKVIHASHDLLMQFLCLNDQLSPKLPCNCDSKGPGIYFQSRSLLFNDIVSFWF